MNQTERLMTDLSDHIAATLEQPSDMRAWEQLLIYCPSAATVTDGAREAFRAGWYINAAVDDQPADYLKGCEEVDWSEYAKASPLSSTNQLPPPQAADRIEQLEARLDRAVTRGLEQVEQIATLEAALREIADLAEECSDDNSWEGSLTQGFARLARAALAEGQDK